MADGLSVVLQAGTRFGSVGQIITLAANTAIQEIAAGRAVLAVAVAQVTTALTSGLSELAPVTPLGVLATVPLTALSVFPTVAWSTVLSALTTPTSPNVPLVSYTILNTGIYRVSVDIYPTTLNSGPWLVEVLAGFSQKGEAGYVDVQVALCQLQAGSASITPGASALALFTAGTVVKFYTVSVSGNQNSGVYSVVGLIEQLA
jgi:hypothetical protein